MNIVWHGLSCFKIQGENTTLITDPFDQSVGLRVPKMVADIVTVSRQHFDHNNSAPFIITGPGEYEVKGVFIYGIFSFPDKNTIYRIEIDDLTLVHLGGLSHSLANGQLENLKRVDILMVPVGGGDALDAKAAATVINQLEPRIVIPMHYKIPSLSVKLDTLDKFCKEIGVCPAESLDKFKITKKDLPAEEMKVVVLNS